MGTGSVDTGFLWGNLIETNHLQDKGIDRRITLNGVFSSSMGMEWIGLAQYMDRRRALVTAVMNNLFYELLCQKKDLLYLGFNRLP
jgi:hypothetical protein